MPRSQRPATKQVTIRDVARAAGVSATTVSNVLNDRTDAMTSETLQRVQEAIRALNYHPSSIARGLVTRRTATIGLILAEIETPLFLQALNFIEPIARGAGYNVLLCNARNLEDERQALNLLLEKQVAGIIFLSTSQYLDDDHLLELQLSGPPVVLINRATIHDRFDQINWDNATGVATAVEHLVRLGHHRIAHLRGPIERRSSDERLQGYRLALEKCGLEYCENYVRPGDFTAPPDTWRQSTLELLALSPKPTAIIAADDIVAAVVIRTVQNAGLRVPQDVAVVGIDDQPFSIYLNPALTTVQLPVIEAGKCAVQMLLDRIASRRATPKRMKLPCPLIVRESCGATLPGE
jgi:DNA-binding LacI/PurR family transcriptional regulator